MQGLSSADPVRTNFAWLLRLRWGAIVSQLATIAIVDGLFDIALDVPSLLSVVALTALSNALCARYLATSERLREWMLASLMALDFVLLTLLLYLAGGASNPFSVLYLVHVALSAAVLGARHAWGLAALSSAAFGSLFLLPPRHDAVVHAMGMHDHAQHGSMGLHFQGMWAAFSIAAFVIVYFVTRVSRDLAAQRASAAEARTSALRSEKLASLATLAAGAAHELATPLSTIAVIAKELERDLSTGQHGKGAEADARLIREEVERCRTILSLMASDAGESMGEGFRETTSAALIDEALEALKQRARVRVSGGGDDRLCLPVRSVAAALRALVTNALDASAESQAVEVEVLSHGSSLGLCVTDRGSGMHPDTLRRAGEPFFTTKEPGRGMGLGIFLSRAVIERLGGSLRFESALGTGTQVFLELPRKVEASHRVKA